MKKTRIQKKSGSILLMVMIAMLIIAALATGSMAKGKFTALASEYGRQRQQAQWFCETGLAQAMKRFYAGNFNDFSITKTDAGKSHQIAVATGSPSTISDGRTSYTVTSKVTVDGSVRKTISEVFTVETENTTVPTLNSGLILGTADDGGTAMDIKGGSNLGNHSHDVWTEAYIFGNLTSSGGLPNVTDLTFLITGTVNGGTPTTGSFIHTNSVASIAGLITAIHTKMDDYSSAITAGSSSQRTYANNGTLYVPAGTTTVLKSSNSSDVTIGNYQISGKGTVIIQGDLVVKNNFAVEQGATLLVGGNIETKNSSNFNFNNSDSVLYIGGSLVIKNNGNIQGTVLVEDSIDTKHGSSSSTFFFTNGTIEFKNSATIEGIIIANKLIAKNKANIYMNANAFPNWLKTLIDSSSSGSGSTATVLSVTPSDWKIL